MKKVYNILAIIIIINIGCLHSKNVAEHYYDKPLLKDKATTILNVYEKLWEYAIITTTTTTKTSNSDENPPFKYHKKE